MSRRRRSVGFRLGAAALLLTVAGLGAELAARATGADIPAWRLVDAQGVIMTGHPTRLWGLSPGKKQNGDATANVNALGLRGPLPEDPKPAGRLRILVVGDSTFFGHGVEDDETFPAQLGQRLRADGLEVETINGGVPGYSTEQTRIQLDEVGWSLEPDLLVIGNLWSDNNVDAFRDEDLLKTARAGRDNPLFASHFFRLLAGAVDRARGGTGARLVTWTRDSQFPTQGERRVSLQRYAENLDGMVRDAASRGIGAAIVGPCNVGMVDGRYPDGASWDTFFDAQRRVAEHHHIPWIRTLLAMREAAGDNAEALFVDVMHPSAKGHAVFAAATATALEAAGWPEDRLVSTEAAFPFDTLVDSRFGSGDANAASPQRNLFGEVRSEGPPPLGDAAANRRGDEGSAGGGPTRHDAPGARWSVDGSVLGGTPPFRVEARGATGTAVSSVRLGANGPFALTIRSDLEVVDLVATDATGKTAAGTGRRGDASIELDLR